MNIYIDLLLIAAITIYIVDLSGFTESWRSAVARLLKVKELRSLKPFDCAKCMTWWTCIAYSLVTGEFSLEVLAFIAALSFFSYPLSQFFIFLNEGVNTLINKLAERL